MIGRGIRRFSARSNGTGNQSKTQFFFRELYQVGKLTAGITIFTFTSVIATGYFTELWKRKNTPKAPGRLLDVQLSNTDGSSVKKTTIHVQQLRKENSNVTVLFDGSLGENSFDWSKVFAQGKNIANFIAIDRPGMAYSSGGIKPRTSKQIAQEYVDILKELKVSGKLILVGHGIGSSNMRALAAKISNSVDHDLPFEVAGMIFMDPTAPNMRKKMVTQSPDIEAVFKKQDKNVELLWKLSHIGIPRLIDVIQSKKLEEMYTGDAISFVLHLSSSPKNRKAILDEYNDLQRSDEQLEDPSFLMQEWSTYRQLPVVFLQTIQSVSAMLGLPAERDDLDAIWAKEQANYIESLQSSGKMKSVSVEIPKSKNKSIIHDYPHIAISSVLALVNEVEGEGKSGLRSLQDDQCSINR